MTPYRQLLNNVSVYSNVYTLINGSSDPFRTKPSVVWDAIKDVYSLAYLFLAGDLLGACRVLDASREGLSEEDRGVLDCIILALSTKNLSIITPNLRFMGDPLLYSYRQIPFMLWGAVLGRIFYRHTVMACDHIRYYYGRGKVPFCDRCEHPIRFHTSQGRCIW